MRYSSDDFVPGTVNLFAARYDGEGGSGSEGGSGALKKGPSGIILLPQPLDLPNDPLNWLRPRKMWHFFVVCFITALTAATSNDAGAAQDSMNEVYSISYDSFNTGAGILFIFIGWLCIFFAPALLLYGRRITYIVCLLAGTLGCVWFGVTKKTSDLLFLQIFVGMLEACAEAQVQQLILDIFFQHLLGAALTAYIMATLIGTFLGPLVANYISQRQLFRWVGYWGAIICGGTLLVVLVACEETVFDRTRYIPVISASDTASADAEPKLKRDCDSECGHVTEKAAALLQTRAALSLPLRLPLRLPLPLPLRGHPQLVALASTNAATHNAEQRHAHGALDAPRTYLQRVAIITPLSYLEGYGVRQYVRRFFTYFRVFTIPAVWFLGILWGLQDAYMTFFLTTQDDFFTAAPWNYSENGVAIMNVATLIGAVVGCLVLGIGLDYHVMWLAKRNHSVYEPEMRLWLLAITLVVLPVGLIMFGVGAARQWPWQVIYVGLGFIGFGWGSIGDTAMLYLMDLYPEIVIQGMVGVSIINNTLACIFTFTCSYWLDALGTQNTYIALAVIDFATIACAVPMYVWGKQCRRATKNLYIKLVELTQGM